jgi:hypothetical protein
MIRKAYSVYGAQIGVCSEIDLEFLKNFTYKFGHFVRELNYIPTSMDATIYLIEDDLPLPHFSPLSNRLFCVGDFIGINKKYGDVHSIIRYVMYAYTLSALERFRRILSCHASAVFDPKRNTVLLFVGTAGAGKTSLLLAAIKNGWQIVGNDLVAIEINEEYPLFYTGPANCPVKSHTLKPYIDFLTQKGVQFDRDKVEKGDWLATDNLELTPFSVSSEAIRNSRVLLILPKIESSATRCSLLKVDTYHRIREEIYEYATEKIRAESLMNYRFPVPSFDDQQTMYQRIGLVESFIKHIEGVYFAFGHAEGTFQEIERIL